MSYQAGVGRFGFVWVALSVFLQAACSGDGEETALARGDRAFAHSDYEEALAEYRLALLEENPGTEGLVRVAHAYATLGRVDEARALYEEAAKEDIAHADQAVADFVALAERSHRSGDPYGMASAMEAAFALRPGVMAEELALPLAHHYSSPNIGEHGRALPLYLRALGGQRDEPDIILDAALAHKEIGDCERALIFLGEFREKAPRREREVRWHVGECSFQLSQELVAADSLDEALARLDTLLQLAEPRTLLPQAYFDKGDILAELGRCNAALEAYRQVSVVQPSGTGPLAHRARDRVDEIRFGRGANRQLTGGLGC